MHPKIQSQITQITQLAVRAADSKLAKQRTAAHWAVLPFAETKKT